jgi:hypothetical protein
MAKLLQLLLLLLLQEVRQITVSTGQQATGLKMLDINLLVDLGLKFWIPKALQVGVFRGHLICTSL